MFSWIRKRTKRLDPVPQEAKELVELWSVTGNLDLLKQALKKGLPVTAQADVNVGTPLHVASRLGYLDAIVHLYSSGVKDTVTNSSGEYAIHQAAAHGCDGCVQYLLKNLASDTDSQDDGGHTPLMLAVKHGHMKVVELLVRRGADVVSKVTRGGQGAIHLCADAAVLRYLMQTTAVDINTPDTSGRSLLLLAVERQQLDVVTEAVALRADTLKQDAEGQNALHIACIQGAANLVPQLIQAGVSTRHVDKQGYTPLERALLLHDVDTAYAFYCAGALFTQRQLLLLGILLRNSTLLSALRQEAEASASGVALPCTSRLQAALQHPDVIDRVTVLSGPVPLRGMSSAEFNEAINRLHDPVARPAGSKASSTLIAVFSKFLRHSMGEARERDWEAPRLPGSRHSDPALRSVQSLDLNAPDAADKQPVSHMPTGNLVQSPDDSGRSDRIKSDSVGTERRSLERLLPHYLRGLTTHSPRETATCASGASALPAPQQRSQSVLPSTAHGGLPGQATATEASAFWGKSKTARTETGCSSVDSRASARRSRTVDPFEYRRRDPWASFDRTRESTSLHGQVSSRRMPLDDASVRQRPRLTAPDQDEMQAFEEMMARRVAVFTRSTSKNH